MVQSGVLVNPVKAKRGKVASNEMTKMKNATKPTTSNLVIQKGSDDVRRVISFNRDLKEITATKHNEFEGLDEILLTCARMKTDTVFVGSESGWNASNFAKAAWLRIGDFDDVEHIDLIWKHVDELTEAMNAYCGGGVWRIHQTGPNGLQVPVMLPPITSSNWYKKHRSKGFKVVADEVKDIIESTTGAKIGNVDLGPCSSNGGTFRIPGTYNTAYGARFKVKVIAAGGKGYCKKLKQRLTSFTAIIDNTMDRSLPKPDRTETMYNHHGRPRMFYDVKSILDAAKVAYTTKGDRHKPWYTLRVCPMCNSEDTARVTNSGYLHCFKHSCLASTVKHDGIHPDGWMKSIKIDPTFYMQKHKPDGYQEYKAAKAAKTSTKKKRTRVRRAKVKISTLPSIDKARKDVRKSIGNLVEAAMQQEGTATCLAYDFGSAKTTAALEAVNNLFMPRCHRMTPAYDADEDGHMQHTSPLVAYACTTNALADQSYEQLTRLKRDNDTYNVLRLVGKTHLAKTGFCPHGDDIRKAGSLGVNTTKAVCASCDKFKECPYFKQRDRLKNMTHGVVVTTIDQTRHFEEQNRFKRVRLMIFDECPTNSLMQATVITRAHTAAIASWPDKRAGQLASCVTRALSTHSNNSTSTKDQLWRLWKTNAIGGVDGTNLYNILQAASGLPKHKFTSLLNHVASLEPTLAWNDLDASLPRWVITLAQTLQDNPFQLSLTNTKGTARLTMYTFPTYSPTTKACVTPLYENGRFTGERTYPDTQAWKQPILILDANGDVNADHWRRFLPGYDVAFKVARVKQQKHMRCLYKMIDTSRRSLQTQKGMANAVAAVLEFAKHTFPTIDRTDVFTHLEDVKRLQQELDFYASHMTPYIPGHRPHTFVVHHFNEAQGLNAYSGSNIVVVGEAFINRNSIFEQTTALKQRRLTQRDTVYSDNYETDLRVKAIREALYRGRPMQDKTPRVIGFIGRDNPAHLGLVHKARWRRIHHTATTVVNDAMGIPTEDSLLTWVTNADGSVTAEQPTYVTDTEYMKQVDHDDEDDIGNYIPKEVQSSRTLTDYDKRLYASAPLTIDRSTSGSLPSGSLPSGSLVHYDESANASNASNCVDIHANDNAKVSKVFSSTFCSRMVANFVNENEHSNALPFTKYMHAYTSDTDTLRIKKLPMKRIRKLANKQRKQLAAKARTEGISSPVVVASFRTDPEAHRNQTSQRKTDKQHVASKRLQNTQVPLNTPGLSQNAFAYLERVLPSEMLAIVLQTILGASERKNMREMGLAMLPGQDDAAAYLETVADVLNWSNGSGCAWQRRKGGMALLTPDVLGKLPFKRKHVETSAFGVKHLLFGKQSRDVQERCLWRSLFGQRMCDVVDRLVDLAAEHVDASTARGRVYDLAVRVLTEAHLPSAVVA